MSSISYRPEIDGLRSVAVLPVILFHAGFEIFSGGFVGVDVFFVISGFLITSILIRDLEQGRFSILQFYERRARRILPALFAVMIVCLPFAWAWLLPRYFHDFAQSLVAVSLFSSNILFWLKIDYFSPGAEDWPLLHTWSLAVEEQFYIIFPLLLLLVFVIGRRRMVWLLAGLALVSVGVTEWGWRNAPEANFFLLPSRAWELLAGALAAYLMYYSPPSGRDLPAAMGLGLILLSIFLLDGEDPFPSLWALLPVSGTTLILIFAQSGTQVARLLSLPFFVGIGLISYSAYLWHQPIFAFARIRMLRDLDLPMAAALTVLSLLLAWLSWRFVEQPFRKRGAKGFVVTRPVIFALSAAGLVFFAGVGAIGHKNIGFPSRFSPPDFVAQGLFALANQVNGFCFYGVRWPRDVRGEDEIRCTLGAEDVPPGDVMLFGDSFAGQWEPLLEKLAKDSDTHIDSFITNHCFPTLNDEILADRSEIWQLQCEINRGYVSKHMNDYKTIIIGGAWAGIAKSDFDDKALGFIEHVMTETKATLVILDAPYYLSRTSVENRIYRRRGPLIPDAERERLYKRLWHKIEVRADRDERILLVRRADLFGTQNPLLTDEGHPFSLDGAHVSIYGALQAETRLGGSDIMPRLDQAIRGKGPKEF